MIRLDDKWRRIEWFFDHFFCLFQSEIFWELKAFWWIICLNYWTHLSHLSNQSPMRWERSLFFYLSRALSLLVGFMIYPRSFQSFVFLVWSVVYLLHDDSIMAAILMMQCDRIIVWNFLHFLKESFQFFWNVHWCACITHWLIIWCENGILLLLVALRLWSKYATCSEELKIERYRVLRCNCRQKKMYSSCSI